MKIVYGKQVYDQLPLADQVTLKPIDCDCIVKSVAAEAFENCESCQGTGTVYEGSMSKEDEQAIIENLRRQGVPIRNN